MKELSLVKSYKEGPGPEVIKPFLLLNVKMPTIVVILTFISRIIMFDFDDLNLKIPLILSILTIVINFNFMLSFVISGPGSLPQLK